jgi:hypothetical protein
MTGGQTGHCRDPVVSFGITAVEIWVPSSKVSYHMSKKFEKADREILQQGQEPE